MVFFCGQAAVADLDAIAVPILPRGTMKGGNLGHAIRPG